MKSFRELQETKGAPKGYHFTRDGKLKKGDAGADGPGGKKLRSDPLDKQRSKIPPLPEEIERRADAKVVKTHAPDGRVVFRKQKPEIKVEKMDHAAMARDALRKGDMKAYKRHQNSAQAASKRIGEEKEVKEKNVGFKTDPKLPNLKMPINRRQGKIFNPKTRKFEAVDEAAPKPLNRSDHTHTVHIDGEGQYKVKAKSMAHAKKAAFKQAGISKLHGHPTMEPKTRIYGEDVNERSLTPGEKKKREEIAKAIERDNPSMPMDKKMAIATDRAKTSAENYASDKNPKRVTSVDVDQAKRDLQHAKLVKKRQSVKTEVTVNTADIAKKQMINKSDKDKLSKIRQMLDKEKKPKTASEHAFAFGRQAFLEGRKPKDAPEEGPEHIIMQLRKSVNMRGQKDVTFKDGKSVKVNYQHAQRALDKYNRMKPLERLAFQKQIAKSHNHLQQAIK
jgi:hypothetical protein